MSAGVFLQEQNVVTYLCQETPSALNVVWAEVVLFQYISKIIGGHDLVHILDRRQVCT